MANTSLTHDRSKDGYQRPMQRTRGLRGSRGRRQRHQGCTLSHVADTSQVQNNTLDREPTFCSTCVYASPCARVSISTGSCKTTSEQDQYIWNAIKALLFICCASAGQDPNQLSRSNSVQSGPTVRSCWCASASVRTIV